MHRRDGNVIGNPIATNDANATGVFRISATQQKKILTKFPPHAEAPEKPLFVSTLRGRIESTTQPGEGLSPDLSLRTGTLLIRIASPQNYKERTSSAFSAFQILDDDFDGFAPITGYSVEITMSTSGAYSASEARSAFGTLFLTAGVANSFFSNNGTNENFVNLPRVGTPFEDSDNSFLINLDEVSSGPVNRTGNTGLVGMPKDGNYSIRVFTENSAGKVSSATESNNVICSHSHTNNQTIDPPGYQYFDILVQGAGASSGRVIGQGSSGAGGAGAMVISYAHEHKSFLGSTYTVTVGTGGFNANGGDSSVMGITARGGGRGANVGFVSTAGGTHYFHSAALAGGCGGGNVGLQGGTAGAMFALNGGSTGGRTGNSSQATNTLASYSATFAHVFENVGGGFQISAGDTLRTLYSEGHITRIQTNVPITVAHGGGGIGAAGNAGNMGHQGIGGNGKYIKWATPGISAKIPQMDRTPFGISNMGNVDGGSNEAGSTANRNRGFYGAGGNGFNSNQFTNRGGGGLGKFETQNFQSTMDGFTYSATGVNGTGAGGGSIRSNNNDTNSVFDGRMGGDGIVIIRMANGQYSNFDTRPHVTGSYDETAVGTYRYYIFDGAGTFKP
nr:hypothetical protein 14 [Burkholderiaceae bacterium]